jgi:hypothetical protein
VLPQESVGSRQDAHSSCLCSPAPRTLNVRKDDFMHESSTTFANVIPFSGSTQPTEHGPRTLIRAQLRTQPHFNAPRRYLEVTPDLRTTANLRFYDIVGDGGGHCGTSSQAMGMNFGVKAVHQHCVWMKIEITGHNYPLDLDRRTLSSSGRLLVVENAGSPRINSPSILVVGIPVVCLTERWICM